MKAPCAVDGKSSSLSLGIPSNGLGMDGMLGRFSAILSAVLSSVSCARLRSSASERTTAGSGGNLGESPRPLADGCPGGGAGFGGVAAACGEAGPLRGDLGGRCADGGFSGDLGDRCADGGFSGDLILLLCRESSLLLCRESSVLRCRESSPVLGRESSLVLGRESSLVLGRESSLANS